MIAVNHGASAAVAEYAIIAAAAAVTAVSGMAALTWNKAPWWRRWPTPRRQLDNDRDLVKIERLRRRHRDITFPDPVLPKVTPEPEFEERP